MNFLGANEARQKIQKQETTKHKQQKHENGIRHLYTVKLHNKNLAGTNKNEKLETGVIRLT